MDELQRQILELSQKIDNLYTVVEQVKGQMTIASSHEYQQASQPLSQVPLMRSSSPSITSQINSGMEHKDILVEGNSWYHDSHSVADNTLSCDLQVRRLTAQLTAAYNRIAALEEQLLATRVH